MPLPPGCRFPRSIATRITVRADHGEFSHIRTHAFGAANSRLPLGVKTSDCRLISRPVKTTEYFRFMSSRPDRRGIRVEWIQRVVDQPEKRHIQADGRLRLWGKVPESGNRYLRVIVLEDGETVHNAFFDRGFRE